VQGYVHLQKSKSDRGASAQLATPTQGLIPLAGIWAMATWRQHGPDKDIGNPLSACMLDTRGNELVSSTTKDYDCGFDTKNDIPMTIFRQRMLNNTRQEGWDRLEFVERPVIGAGAREMARMDEALRVHAADLMWSTNGYKHEEKAWVQAFIASSPEARKRHDAKLFALQLEQMENGRSTDEVWMQAYRAADPAHEAAYQQRRTSNANTLAYDRESFDRRLASATSIDRFSLSQIALREGGQKAANWWNKFGTNLEPGEPSIHLWCNSGVAAACEDVQREERMQAIAEQDTASSGTSPFSYDPNASTQALIDHNRAVNSANCARADKGALISCNRN
ncbi:MAG: hypothetical protein SGJ21_14540, partial [Alphaproteobacteria bacterium]|nr:hypothetical protein [Alphaproteobacteria bacterium]